jgi:hypothetical protein
MPALVLPETLELCGFSFVELVNNRAEHKQQAIMEVTTAMVNYD